MHFFWLALITGQGWWGWFANFCLRNKQWFFLCFVALHHHLLIQSIFQRQLVIQKHWLLLNSEFFETQFPCVCYAVPKIMVDCVAHSVLQQWKNPSGCCYHNCNRKAHLHRSRRYSAFYRPAATATIHTRHIRDRGMRSDLRTAFPLKHWVSWEKFINFGTCREDALR